MLCMSSLLRAYYPTPRLLFCILSQSDINMPHIHPSYPHPTSISPKKRKKLKVRIGKYANALHCTALHTLCMYCRSTHLHRIASPRIHSLSSSRQPSSAQPSPSHSVAPMHSPHSFTPCHHRRRMIHFNSINQITGPEPPSSEFHTRDISYHIIFATQARQRQSTAVQPSPSPQPKMTRKAKNVGNKRK